MLRKEDIVKDPNSKFQNEAWFILQDVANDQIWKKFKADIHGHQIIFSERDGVCDVIVPHNAISINDDRKRLYLSFHGGYYSPTKETRITADSRKIRDAMPECVEMMRDVLALREESCRQERMLRK